MVTATDSERGKPQIRSSATHGAGGTVDIAQYSLRSISLSRPSFGPIELSVTQTDFDSISEALSDIASIEAGFPYKMGPKLCRGLEQNLCIRTAIVFMITPQVRPQLKIRHYP